MFPLYLFLHSIGYVGKITDEVFAIFTENTEQNVAIAKFVIKYEYIKMCMISLKWDHSDRNIFQNDWYFFQLHIKLASW